jgi:tRNA threonylcarbamoyl adenosine modification protein YeaZ
MSNFLAVDTSGNHLAVVAVKDGTTYATYVENCAMKHAVSIMPAVDETLKKANLQLKDCDFFAAVVGAGSFTGIRIGISTVKGFCLAHGKPALAITSFDVAAYNALDTKTNKILCLVDALHDCYYACGYENGKIVYSPAYLTEEDVLALQQEVYALVGHGEMPISAKATVYDIDPVFGLAEAAKALSADGKFGELTALYVRKSSAELNAENVEGKK